MSETPETIDSLRQKLRVAERVKQAAIDCTKSLDTILDELVWERQDLDAHEIPSAHLQTMIARYPHHAEALAEFAARWNADKPLSDEELNSMEVDEEEAKRSTARCLLMLKWAMRIKKSESALAARDARIAELEQLNRMVGYAADANEKDAIAAHERIAELEAERERLLNVIQPFAHVAKNVANDLQAHPDQHHIDAVTEISAEFTEAADVQFRKDCRLPERPQGHSRVRRLFSLGHITLRHWKELDAAIAKEKPDV